MRAIAVLVPVFESPLQVDSTNIAEFRARINELVGRYGAVVVDCSEVTVIGPSGMRVLRFAARDSTVTLVNPSPSLQLMAAAYGFEVDHTDTGSVPSEGSGSERRGTGVRSMTQRLQVVPGREPAGETNRWP